MSDPSSGDSGFHRLLQRLDPDPIRAAQEYARLRRALERFFDWRGSPIPEDGADEVLARIAARLDEGIAVGDVSSFAHGIARFVFLEQTRAGSRLTRLGDVEPCPVEDRPATAEELATALDDCLNRLRADERALVLDYYAGGEGRAKIEHRRRLARGMGISENALRIRLRRSRDGLEDCIKVATTRIARSTHSRMGT